MGKWLIGGALVVAAGIIAYAVWRMREENGTVRTVYLPVLPNTRAAANINRAGGLRAVTEGSVTVDNVRLRGTTPVPRFRVVT